MVLDSERFADVAPPAVYAALLDESRSQDSIPSIYPPCVSVVVASVPL